MIKFEFYLNAIENSSVVISCKENSKDINKSIFDFLTNSKYDNFISIDNAIECASWGELANIGETFETNEFTMICIED